MYHITDEWAKQLALEIWGPEIDFAGITFFHVENTSIIRIPIMGEVSYQPGDLSMAIDEPFDFEEINVTWIHDYFNDELTNLGYGPKTNTLVIGLSRLMP